MSQENQGLASETDEPSSLRVSPGRGAGNNWVACRYMIAERRSVEEVASVGRKASRRRRRRRYEKPTVRSQEVFEQTALLCEGKQEGQSLPCYYVMYS